MRLPCVTNVKAALNVKNTEQLCRVNLLRSDSILSEGFPGVNQLVAVGLLQRQPLCKSTPIGVDLSRVSALRKASLNSI